MSIVRKASFKWAVNEAVFLFFEWKFRRAQRRTTPVMPLKIECELESVFRNYLKFFVKQLTSLSMRFVPGSIPNSMGEQMVSALTAKKPDTAQHEFKVLSPAFYTRFVCYAQDFESIFRALIENGTIWLSDARLLPKLVLKKTQSPLEATRYPDYGYYSL